MSDSDSKKTFVCHKCFRPKSLDKYGKDYHSRHGHRTICKECLAKRMREYRQRPEVKPRMAATQRKAELRVRHTKRYKDMHRRAFLRWHEKSPRLNIHQALKLAVRRRPTENPATTDQVMDLWKKQKNICAVSGVQMTWGRGTLMPTSISLDRIDGTKGYSIGNIRLVCYQVNTFRGRWSDAEMLVMAKAIVAHMEPRVHDPFTFVA